jgi:hypothetical protein
MYDIVEADGTVPRTQWELLRYLKALGFLFQIRWNYVMTESSSGCLRETANARFTMLLRWMALLSS